MQHTTQTSPKQTGKITGINPQSSKKSISCALSFLATCNLGNSSTQVTETHNSNSQVMLQEDFLIFRLLSTERMSSLEDKIDRLLTDLPRVIHTAKSSYRK